MVKKEILIRGTVTTVTNSKLASALDAIRKAEEGLSKNVWAISKAFYEITESECFKDDFGTLEVLADTVGYSVSSISKLARTYKLRLTYEDAKLEKMTYGQASELLPLVKTDSVEEFLNTDLVDENSTQKEIRMAVKYFKNGVDDVVDMEDEDIESTENTEGTEETPDNVYYFNNVAYELTEEQVKLVVELLESFK